LRELNHVLDYASVTVYCVKSVIPCSKGVFLKYLLIAIGLSPDGSGYFTCIQNMKLVTTKFKSGGLHDKHVVATWSLGNHLSICF
jgi:hypothetical protein